MRNLMNDEAGFIVSSELVIVLTVGVLAMVVGLVSVRDAVLTELGDLGEAFGAIDQTYSFRNMGKGAHASVKGAGFGDLADDCDCKGINFAAVCGKTQVVVGGAGNTEAGVAP